jgi:hypothetical protein
MREKNPCRPRESHSISPLHSRRDANFCCYRALAGAGSTGRISENSGWLLKALGKVCS